MAVLLDDPVANRPDDVALTDDRRTVSWGELNQRVNRLVDALRTRGLRSDDHLVAMLGNQAEAIEVSLACAHGGWQLVPVNWHWVADELAYVIGDTDAAAVIVDARWVGVVRDALAIDDCPQPDVRIDLKSRMRGMWR